MHDIDDYAFRSARIQAAQIARQFGFNYHEKQDLEQELLLRLWQQRGHFNPSRGQWSTFVSTVFKRHVLNYLAQRKAAKRDVRKCILFG